MKISNAVVKVNTQSNSEYSNTVIWWYVSQLTLVLRLKDKSVENNYYYNNLLMYTQYKDVNYDIKNMDG